MLENLLVPIITSIVAAIVGVVFNVILHRVRKMEQDIAMKIDKDEARELIADKLESYKVQLEEIRKDIEKIDVQTISEKLDKLINSK